MRNPLDDRHNNDPHFKALVDHFEAYYHAGEVTPSDIRTAANYAAIRWEMRRTDVTFVLDGDELRRVHR